MPQLTKQDQKELQKRYLKVAKKSSRENVKAVKKLVEMAVKVENLEDKFQVMSDAELKNMTQVFKDRLKNSETLDDILFEAYAVCREAARRVLRQRHYFVQVMGGIALHQGRIAELQTGEGKTLMSTLPAYLNALSGNGVHIVTVNEYLAKRDAEWMGKVFKFLGLSVGVTLTRTSHAEKLAAYNSDITYGTNSEFGFDYLRDNMARSSDRRTQRQLNFVIIDEVDSILIDEARTPLIISGPSGKSSDMYNVANRFAATLSKSTNADGDGNLKAGEIENGDYLLNEKDKSVRLTDKGIAKAERFFKIDSLADAENIELNYYINNALKAHAVMKRDNDYIVEKGQVIIIDQFTGRKMEGRRYNGGLHQAIEAKEHVSIKEEDQTLATITYQNYFRLYKKMSGMTGTAKTEEKEFNTIYNVDVVVIPTNKPLVRTDFPDLIYTTTEGKLRAIVKRIKEVNQTGQPLLVGTVTVEKSEQLSKLLKKEGISHNVLNAKNHQREAETIAQAGRVGAVTIATNMAGRGTDILLGGNPEFLAKQEMLKEGYTEQQIELATSFAEGDSQQEELKKVFAQLLEKHKSYTDVEKEKAIQCGGLYVLGTERHDSRRIDNQLRGRSGRQGDAGSSVFFLSAEDDMLRIFGGTLQSTLGFLRVDEDTPIESKIISKQIEYSQRMIEGRHFSARKNVLKFDDVNNAQRTMIYRQRNEILDGADIHQEICKMAETYALKVLEEACGGNEKMEDWDFDALNQHLSRHYPPDQAPIVKSNTFATAKEVHAFLTEKTVELLNQKYDEQPTEQDQVPFKDAEKLFLLNTIDRLWMQHLEDLDSLKQGVGLQSIGQHDPVAVYKREGFKLFDQMNDTIAFDTIKQLFFKKIRKHIVRVANTQENLNPDKSPNLPCPCGSGKKYKNCCYDSDLLEKLKQQKQQPALAQTPNRPLTKKEEYALKRLQRAKSKNQDS